MYITCHRHQHIQ